MNLFRPLKSLIVLAFLLTLGLGIGFTPASAQELTTEGLDTVGTTAGLSAQDPTIIVAKLIRGFLLILGVVAMCIVIYAGFLWMTAGGNAERVDRAKKMLINALIGLAIILASVAITQYVLDALVKATGGGDSEPGNTDDGGPNLGGSSGVAFVISSHRPTGQVTTRNVVPQITFSYRVDPATVTSDTIKFNYVDAANGQVIAEIPGVLTTNGNLVSFTPATPCPSPNEDRGCFDEFARVDTVVTDAIKNTVGTKLSCSNGKCNSSFIAGDVVDTQSPSAELTLPDDNTGVPSESLVDVQVHATDDAEVSVAEFAVSDLVFDAVPATGPDFTDVLIETIWDTAGLLNGEAYRLTATVRDIAGNTDSDSVTVDMRPPTCFNEIIDGIETGLNCGGDTASADYCGACDGSSCSVGSDCGSGSCVSGVCLSMPQITAVTPPDGAPGTFVTLSGEHFGNFTGTVSFAGAAGPVDAILAACGSPWRNNQVIVVVPEGAIDGPITLTTANGLSDDTENDNGLLIADFDVNTLVHPGVCEINPDRGASTDAVTVFGNSFGEARDSSVVNFGSVEAGSYNAWSDTSADVTVPALADGDYAVEVVVDGVRSNAVEFTVAAQVGAAPTIVNITPGSGGIGQYITLSGTDFGGSTGTVWFENEFGQALASTDFPQACADDFWKDNEVLVIVPAMFNDGATSIFEDTYTVHVVTSSGAESNRLNFTVTADQPTPGLCSIDPDAGLAGETVTLYGANFGGSKGQVSFSPNAGAIVQSWSADAVAVGVPAGAQTGAVTLVNSDGVRSNPVNFAVTAGDETAAVIRQAAYAWSFSSGYIPTTPEPIFECSATQVSGVPNNEFTEGGACINVMVHLEFTVPMNESSLVTGSKFEECQGPSGDPCSVTVPVAGEVWTAPTIFRFIPDELLKTSTNYLVTLDTTVQSADGAPLAAPISWSFLTRESSVPCRLEDVVISPDDATIRELNGTQDFTVSPVNGCLVLSDNIYSWNWTVGQNIARFDTVADPECTAGNSTCALVQALAEGETKVKATETVSRLFEEADLTINFSDPYITNYWPNCTEACVNSEVGASFNVPMLRLSVEAPQAVSLYRCANETCNSLTPVAGASVVCTYDANQKCTGFAFTGLTLAESSFYRVIVSGRVVSTSGVPLIRTNYGGDFSWTFRVREDATLCAVDRISVSPSSALKSQVNESQMFTSAAYGEADSCSVSGQRLSGFSYSWDWTNPIADADLDDDATTRVADWYSGGTVDTSIAAVAPGCTASCVAGGSQAHAAICGDSVRGYGEECDDGNVAAGDGCSATCLREGSVRQMTCGRNGIERLPSGAGEDCDDGKQCDDGSACLIDGECSDGSTCRARDNDGCSALCVAEGSSSIGAMCGNNDVAHINPAFADGEECDDGNAVRGDGCSNECLWEGSPTLSEIGGAVCGNGGNPETPAEECDDGNTNDNDGCSSSCLWEGSSSSCGNHNIDYAEACDDGNTNDNDGCSSSCLWEGSSVLYSTPSFCGDGLPETGELAACELPTAGDGNIDPVQIASISTGAVFEIDPETKQAMATIEVTETSSNLTTTASLGLRCTAESDMECTVPEENGVGMGGCCLERPTITVLYPNGQDVCRNSALYATFTAEMDLNTFTYDAGQNDTGYRMYAKLDLASVPGASCPADHTSLAVGPTNIFAKAWRAVVQLITGKRVHADTNDCVAPIVGYEQYAVGNGTYKVTMHVGALLVANADYTLVVEGDDAIYDAVVDGVRTKFGVGMNGTQFQPFAVGSEICKLDTVSVLDTNAASPYVFTQGEEEHAFLAEAMSYTTGIPQEIDSIPGVYSWTWGSWEAAAGDQIVTVVPGVSDTGTATVTAAGENGDDAVLVTATISDGAQVTGSGPVTAFLCENPWPAFSQLPWSDTADDEDLGAVESSVGWTNFSTMYCRDKGEEGAAEDLPDVTVVHPPIAPTANILKEYLYEISGSSDAIGVRVVSNPNYLSPEAWYESQGFTGRLAEVEVDGFAAGKDGRTTYIVAPNQASTGALYPNVYVISYNEGASDETRDIYDQMVENLKFAVNVSDVAVCDVADESCSSARSQLRRDTRRLTDLMDVRDQVMAYRSLNSVVPTLPSGTFVRSLSSSVWESWSSILGGALGDQLPVDPINDYLMCGQADSTYSAYDAETCVDEVRGTYICPTDSHAYHYKAVGNDQAFLYADLEYATGTWFNPIETNTVDGVTLVVGNTSSTPAGFTSGAFCDGTSVYGASTTCGDGIVGGTEICELGQLGGKAIDCTTEAALAGTRSQICNATCSGYQDNTAASCIVATCGDGVVDQTAGEDCDDGSKNGAYGFCGNDCTRDSAFFCGDGLLAGGEACDCGVGTVSGDSRAYNADPGSCSVVNGVYTASPNSSCSWDCAGAASYCGDGVIDSGEQCDGVDATWDGKLCSGTSPARLRNQPCVDNNDCGGGVCGGAAVARAVCPLGTTRVKACQDTVGASCTYATSGWATIPCTEIGSCGDGTVDPGEACDDGNTDGTDSCTDQCTANVCGDGYVFVGEEQCDEASQNGQGCDSAYGSSCTACSISCRYEVASGDFCGDGERNGPELCDASDMPYTYYNGSYANTGEEIFGNCDVLDMVIENPDNGKTYTCKNLGVCNGGGANKNGDYCINSNACGTGSCVKPTCGQSCSSMCPFAYSSVPLLLTPNQPGSDTEASADIYSYSDSSTSVLPNAATITVPACRAATSLTADISLAAVDLPTTYILFVTDLSASMAYAVETGDAPVGNQRSRLEVAQAAIPDAVEELFDKLGSNARIGALGYRGLVAGECFDRSDISCTNDNDCGGASTGDHCNTFTSEIENDNKPFGYQFDFVGPEDEDDLVLETASYTADPSYPSNPGHGTFTSEALLKAEDMFDEIRATAAGDNARYIVILLSDGEVTTDTYVQSPSVVLSPDPILVADDFDCFGDASDCEEGKIGYEIYSATISRLNRGWIENMNNWSTNSYDGRANDYEPGQEVSAFNGVDYAYEAVDEDDLIGMYEAIVDSIVEIVVTLVSDNGTDVTETTSTVEDGEDVPLPWPENFICDDENEQEIPIQITFPGVGQVAIDDVRLNYCAP